MVNTPPANSVLESSFAFDSRNAVVEASQHQTNKGIRDEKRREVRRQGEDDLRQSVKASKRQGEVRGGGERGRKGGKGRGRGRGRGKPRGRSRPLRLLGVGSDFRACTVLQSRVCDGVHQSIGVD